jgi:hypothetical protein
MGFLKGVLGGIGFMVGIVVFLIIVLALIFAPHSSNSATGSSGDSYTIKVTYNGPWSGSVGGAGKIESVSGSGDKSFTVGGWPVSATFQKGSTYGTLKAEIWQGNELKQSGSTNADYGVVSISA